MKKITVTLRRSLIGRPESMRKIVRSLGLRKINHSVTHDDTPSIRGQIHKTSHLVEVSEK